MKSMPFLAGAAALAVATATIGCAQSPAAPTFNDPADVAAILAPALTAANGANAATAPIRQPAKRRETAGAAGLTEVRT